MYSDVRWLEGFLQYIEVSNDTQTDTCPSPTPQTFTIYISFHQKEHMQLLAN
jgi:hypothetical protein